MVNPHGEKLINLLVETDKSEILGNEFPLITLSSKSEADLEMLATGAMSPLTGFMGLEDYKSVLNNMRLSNGLIWPLPIVLPVNDSLAKELIKFDQAYLRDNKMNIIGNIKISDVYKIDKEFEAKKIFLTTSIDHPGVASLYNSENWYVSGEIEVFQLPNHKNFNKYRMTPADLRNTFKEKGWKTIVGFQTRNPIHRAHEYLTKCALEFLDGLLIHPIVGETKGDDIPAETRMKCYEVIIENYYPLSHTLLSVYPAFMRYAGPREAIFHAITRKNYGCTHFIVGRDHAGVGDYYGTYDAQLIFRQFEMKELGIVPLFFEHSFYCKRTNSMATKKTSLANNNEKIFLSGSKVRQMLTNNEPLPEEFTRTEVEIVLRRHYSEKRKNSITKG